MNAYKVTIDLFVAASSENEAFDHVSNLIAHLFDTANEDERMLLVNSERGKVEIQVGDWGLDDPPV